MSHPVFSALIPVVLLVALGYLAGRARWIRAEASKDLSNLVFMVLTPALAKNLVQPALVALIGMVLGLSGLPLVVMVVTTALPMGERVSVLAALRGGRGVGHGQRNRLQCAGPADTAAGDVCRRQALARL